MENANVNVNEENVKETEEKVVDIQQPVEGTVEGAGTPIDGGEPEPAADAEVKPTFKEKFVNGCKTVGRGCKKAAKAAKPYVVGAAIGIGTACYAGLKIYKAVKAGEGNTELGKSDTPLLDMEYNPEADDFDGGDTTAETDGAGIDTSSDVTELETVLDTEL